MSNDIAKLFVDECGELYDLHKIRAALAFFYELSENEKGKFMALTDNEDIMNCYLNMSEDDKKEIKTAVL